MGWPGAASRGPGSATAQLLASPGLCQAATVWLSAAGDRYAARQGGAEESSLILRWVWYPPAHFQISPGRLQAPTPSLQVTSSILIYTDVPLLPCRPSLPVLRRSPSDSGKVAERLCHPGGLQQSCGEPREPELPAAPQPRPKGCWWLWWWEGAHLSGTGCYWICCREAKPGRLGYKHPDNKDL